MKLTVVGCSPAWPDPGGAPSGYPSKPAAVGSCSTAGRDGDPRGHLSLEEVRAAFEQSGARELSITHRPCELDSPGGFEFARDGLVRDV